MAEWMGRLWNGGDGKEPSRWGELPSATDAADQAPSHLNKDATQAIHAELALDETFFYARRDNETMLHLINHGPTTLHVGGDDLIEQYAADGLWYRLPLGPGFSARNRSIAPGDAFSQPIAFPIQLPAGNYRIVKGVQSVDLATSELSEPVYLAAKFLLARDE